MTFSNDIRNKNSPMSDAEETLRLLAKSPVPDGLEERVHAHLLTAPRHTSFFSFKGVLGTSAWMQSAALRTAAAAAIVCVVAGGGWQLYSHVQTGSVTQGVAIPARVDSGNGFATSGAIHKPDPLKAPVVTHQQPADHQLVSEQTPTRGSKYAKSRKPTKAKPPIQR